MLYNGVESTIYGALVNAVLVVDPRYEALIEFLILILAGIVIILSIGKLNYAVPAWLSALGVWFLTEDTSWAAISFLVVAIFSIFRREH